MDGSGAAAGAVSLDSGREHSMNCVRRLPERAARFVLCALLLAATGGTALAAGDAKSGRAKARVCEACHGLDGLSKIPEAPNLAGQVQNYLVEQLRAFKQGQRKSEQMSLIAPTLSAQDIDDLAAYYAGIEVTVGRVPAE
jgi:cytochrome c553